MLCYKDRCFCPIACANTECYRNKAHIDFEEVERIGLPIAYRGITGCDLYIEVIDESKRVGETN